MKEIIKKQGEIIIPSDPIYLQPLDEFLEESLRRMNMPENDIADVAISVTELVNNAIVHGNRNNPAKMVEVKINYKKDEVEISITDEGSGFDPDSIPDPLSDENVMKETGRGIFIVRSLMDRFEMLPGKSGNRIRIFKKFTPVEE